MKENKTKLTPDEVLRVAFIHETEGVDQHVLASLLSVNPGRVAEAVIAIRWACENHKVIYKHVAKAKKAKDLLKASQKLIEDGE